MQNLWITTKLEHKVILLIWKITQIVAYSYTRFNKQQGRRRVNRQIMTKFQQMYCALNHVLIFYTSFSSYVLKNILYHHSGVSVLLIQYKSNCVQLVVIPPDIGG